MKNNLYMNGIANNNIIIILANFEIIFSPSKEKLMHGFQV